MKSLLWLLLDSIISKDHAMPNSDSEDVTNAAAAVEDSVPILPGNVSAQALAAILPSANHTLIAISFLETVHRVTAAMTHPYYRLSLINHHGNAIAMATGLPIHYHSA